MTKRLTIAGIIFSLAACLRAAAGQSDLDIQIAIAIAESEATEVSVPPVIAGAEKRTTPAKKQAPAFSPMDLPADAQPTPMEGVTQTLDVLQVRPDEVLVDFGCGHDARFLITAARRGVRRCIGVEIDPAIADSARRYVEHAGLSQRIEIITGDATKVDVQADVGVAYLWPDTLTELRPSIENLDRFASYGFQVPGLRMEPRAGFGKVYVWKKPVAVSRVPITRTTRHTVRLPRGSYCQVCGRNCSNPMAHKNVTTIVGYQNKLAAVPRSATTPLALQGESAPRSQRGVGRWVTKKVCVNGVCRVQTVWQAY